MFKPKDLPLEWQKDLEDNGVLCFALGGEITLRLVTHLHLDDGKLMKPSGFLLKIPKYD